MIKHWLVKGTRYLGMKPETVEKIKKRMHSFQNIFRGASSYDQTWGKIDWTKQENPLEKVTELVEKNATINSKDANDSTILINIINAGQKGWEEAAVFLIQRGADVNAMNLDGDRPLLAAVRRQNSNIVHELLEHNADPNFITEDIDKGAHATTFPLREAAMCVDKEIFDDLLAHNADVKLSNNRGQQAIHNLQNSNNTSPEKHDKREATNRYAMSRLIEKGADVNAADLSGMTPLITAARYGETSIVKQLIEAGADVDHMTKAWHWPENTEIVPSTTALMEAVTHGHTDIVEYALQNHASQNNLYHGAAMNAAKGLKTPEKETIIALLESDGKERLPRAELRKELRNAKTVDERKGFAKRLSADTHTRKAQSDKFHDLRKKRDEYDVAKRELAKRRRSADR